MKIPDKTHPNRTALISDPLPNIPWEEKPDNCNRIIWRHSTNPIVDINPFTNARNAKPNLKA